MNAPTVQTRITSDGLRYRSKATGSPFKGSHNAMSCFVCSGHFPRSQGTFRKFAGVSRFVCLADSTPTKKPSA